MTYQKTPDTRHSLIARLSDRRNAEAWEQFAAIYQPLIYRLARTKGLQDAAELNVLLTGDEGSEAFRQIADHVDGCGACQQSLTQLAGEQQTWSEVSEILRDLSDSKGWDETFPDGTENNQGRLADDIAHHTNIEFLSAPSHPEMLGRLGRYEIERVVGAGGMGIVLKGFDSELNRPMAIKVLAPHLCGSGPARKRFEREARAAAAVADEHVVAIHNVETDGKTPFIVMQFIPGESLQDRVDRDGPLPAKEVLRIGMQAAAGLAAAHEQGVVHRDIKPANILLENGLDRALVTDFGLARTVDDASLTHTGFVAGTPHYMSPEQANGDTIDHQTDLFSLGSVLYFMATGRPPFRADKAMGVLHRICRDQHRRAREVNTDIPYALSNLIDQLLEKKKARRLSTAAQLRHQLSELLAELQEGRRRHWLDAVGRFGGRHRKIISGTAAAVVISIGALVVAFQSLAPDDNDHSSLTTLQMTLRQSSHPPAESRAESESPMESSTAAASLAGSARQPIVSAASHASTARKLDYQLSQIEATFKSKDADQIDTHWRRELRSLHETLDRVQGRIGTQ